MGGQDVALIDTVANAKSAAKERTAPPPPTLDTNMRTPLEKLTIELPAYLTDAMKRAALDRRTSVRHLVMLALKKSGFEIAACDLIPDGRRTRPKTL